MQNKRPEVEKLMELSEGTAYWAPEAMIVAIRTAIPELCQYILQLEREILTTFAPFVAVVSSRVNILSAGDDQFAPQLKKAKDCIKEAKDRVRQLESALQKKETE